MLWFSSAVFLHFRTWLPHLYLYLCKNLEWLHGLQNVTTASLDIWVSSKWVKFSILGELSLLIHDCSSYKEKQVFGELQHFGRQLWNICWQIQLHATDTCSKPIPLHIHHCTTQTSAASAARHIKITLKHIYSFWASITYFILESTVDPLLWKVV